MDQYVFLIEGTRTINQFIDFILLVLFNSVVLEYYTDVMGEKHGGTLVEVTKIKKN